MFQEHFRFPKMSKQVYYKVRIEPWCLNWNNDSAYYHEKKWITIGSNHFWYQEVLQAICQLSMGIKALSISSLVLQEGSEKIHKLNHCYSFDFSLLHSSIVQSCTDDYKELRFSKSPYMPGPIAENTRSVKVRAMSLSFKKWLGTNESTITIIS